MARKYNRDKRGRFASGGGGGASAGGGARKFASKVKSAATATRSAARNLGSKALAAAKNNPDVTIALAQTAVGLAGYGVVKYGMAQRSGLAAETARVARDRVANSRGLQAGNSTLKRARRTGITRRRQRITTM